MNSYGFSSVLAQVINWLSSLTMPIFNVSVLTVWIGIFLLGLGIWVIGSIYGIAMSFVHDVQNDEKARVRDAERERKYYARKAESARLDELVSGNRNPSMRARMKAIYWEGRKNGEDSL